MICPVLPCQLFKGITHHSKRFKLVTFQVIERFNTIDAMYTTDGKLFFRSTIWTQHLQRSAFCLLRVAFLKFSILISPTLCIGYGFIAFSPPCLMRRE